MDTFLLMSCTTEFPAVRAVPRHAQFVSERRDAATWLDFSGSRTSLHCRFWYWVTPDESPRVLDKMKNPLAAWWQRWKARRASASAPIAAAIWLTKEDPRNPFTVPGYDCLAAARSMSTTSDPAVAAQFIALRAASGELHRGKLPQEAREIPSKLEYEYTGEIADGLLFRAAVMEEKWDIFLYDSRIYFCRSWTGALTFVAELKPRKGTMVVTRIWAPGAEEPALVIQQVDYLIKSHLYSQRVPHPLPATLERDGAAVALYSFDQYGRLCCFGTYKNTVREKVYKASALRAVEPRKSK